MEPAASKRTERNLFLGVLFILLGAAILLQRIHVFPFDGRAILWGLVAAGGLSIAIRAFMTRQHGAVFWGSLLFFIGVAFFVHRLMLSGSAPWDFPATLSLALGLSFLMLFIYDPRRIGLLVPVLFFGGYGVLYYLWWWDVVDWSDVRYYFSTYWPALVILWGLTLLFRRK